MKKILVIDGLFRVVMNGITYGRFERYCDAEYYMKSLNTFRR